MENCALYYDFAVVFLKSKIFQEKISIKHFYENFSRSIPLRKLFFSKKSFEKIFD